MKRILNKSAYIYAVVIAVVAAIVGCSVFAFSHMRKAKAEETTDVVTAELVLAEGDTVIAGMTGKDTEGNDIVGDFKIVVPSTVTEIAPSAFIGKGTVTESGTTEGDGGIDHVIPTETMHLVAIEFEDGCSLEEIGALAFAGTDISALTLPSTVNKIGTGAFSQTKLETVSVSSSTLDIGDMAFGNNDSLELIIFGKGNITFGTDVFSHKADHVFNVVVADKAQFAALADADFIDVLTYYVTVEYYYLDSWEGVNTPAYTETKMFGREYNWTLRNGEWIYDGSAYVGTAALGGINTQWHSSVDSAEEVTVSAMNGMLSEDGVSVIKLYASSLNADNSFVARTDLVYNGVEFPVSAINALLTPSSKKVTDETVSITGYEDFDGISSAKTSFGDAGTYTVSIGSDTISVVIARATINLSQASSLAWRAVDGSSTATLLDRTVYLYTTMGWDKQYPSLSRIDDEQKLMLGLAPDEPNIVEVVDSVTRLRGATLTLVENGFSAEYETTKGENDEIGIYTTTATLNADKNHMFVYGGSVLGGAARGLSVALDANGVATVDKVWYVVDMNNWFVFAGGADYSVPTHVYGEPFDIAEPRLANGHDTYFGGTEPKSFTYELTYINGNSRETNQFSNAQFAAYMNAAIPAGNYELRVIAEAFDYVEIDYAEDGVTESGRRDIHCDKFDQTFEFTVVAGNLSPDSVKKINDVLSGARFEYILTASSSDAYESVQRAVAAALEDAVEPVSGLPADNFWTSEQYVGTPSVEVNLASDMTNAYGAFVRPTAAGVYNYYYKIACKNYADVTEEDGEMLTLTVAAFAYVNIPSGAVLSKTYTGGRLTADVDAGSSGGFTVTQNSGGINVGTYNVVLTLDDPDCHLWEGKSLSDADRSSAQTLKFNITKANNDWTVKPTLQNWITGRFDEGEHGIVGNALFGYETLRYVVTTTTRDEKVLFDSRVDDISKLASLGVGDYALTVVIEGNDNYSGIEASTIFHVFKKPGLAWWAVLLIVIAALAVAALVIFILWKKGVFQILTTKLVVAIRTRASVEATIASVRAAKMMEEGKRSVAAAKRREAARERAAARRRAERELPEEERAKAIEEKAVAAEERAEKIRAKAEAMRKRAELMRSKAATAVSAEQSEEPARSEAAATTENAPNETPTEE